jgi:predicted dehydrogenase
MTNKLRIVGVGCGHIISEWLGYLTTRKDVEIVGLVDMKIENAEKWRDKFKLSTAELGSDLATMLKAKKPDLVFDCTTPTVHKQITLTALKHGCHVFGEKPMSDTMANARQMLAAAKKAGKVYAVMQNRRFTPGIRSFQSLIASKKIGALTTLHSTFLIGAHFWTFQQTMKHPLLLDMAIHTFDEARFISGAEPVAVYAKSWRPDGCWFEQEASAVAMFEMSNGIVFTFRGSWCAEGLNTAWDADWHALGTKGSATWDGQTTLKAQRTTKVPRGIPADGIFSTLADLPVTVKPTASVYHAAWLKHSIDCLKSGKKPETHCEDNIKSLAMVHAAIKSSETGKRVKIQI